MRVVVFEKLPVGKVKKISDTYMYFNEVFLFWILQWIIVHCTCASLWLTRFSTLEIETVYVILSPYTLFICLFMLNLTSFLVCVSINSTLNRYNQIPLYPLFGGFWGQSESHRTQLSYGMPFTAVPVQNMHHGVQKCLSTSETQM